MWETSSSTIKDPPKHLDIFKRAPLRLPKPFSDWFPVRVCSCPPLSPGANVWECPVF